MIINSTSNLIEQKEAIFLIYFDEPSYDGFGHVTENKNRLNLVHQAVARLRGARMFSGR